MKQAVAKAFLRPIVVGRKYSRGPVDVLSPSVPDLAVPIPGNTTIDVSWINGTDADTGILETSVEISRNGLNVWTTATVAYPLAFYQFTGLTTATPYDIRIRNKDNAGNFSSYSSIATVSTLGAAADAEPGTISVSSSSFAVVGGSTFNISLTRSGAGTNSPIVQADWAIQNLTGGGSPSPSNGTLQWASGENGAKTATISTSTVASNSVGSFSIAAVRSLIGTLQPSIGTSTATLTITPAISLAALRSAGYTIATDFAGVRNDGLGDPVACRAGLQAAILSAFNNRASLIIPGGTYVISDYLYAYTWRPWDASKNDATNTNQKNHVIVGSYSGARPIIKLANSAPNFDSLGSLRPVLIFRQFEATGSTGTGNPIPSNPLSVPTGFRGGAYTVFRHELRNIEIDTNQHVGAVGLYFPAAQDSDVQDIKVTATNSAIGIWGLPGRTMGARNLEVVGGTVAQIRTTGGPDNDGIAGVVIAGLTLSGASAGCELIEAGDSVPTTVVGFNFSRASGSIFTGANTAATSRNCLSLVDGQVSTSGSAIAFDNTVMKNMYLRNVYVTGTSNLIKSGANATVTGTGTWKLINEYVANDPDGTSPYSAGEQVLATYSVLLPAAASRAEQPVNSVTSSASPPPSDLLSRHVVTFSNIETGAYEDIRTYGAVSGPDTALLAAPSDPFTADTTADARAAIQQAIDVADAQGHGRVLLPRGVWYVGSPGLVLKENTKIFGLGRQVSVLAPHASWQPTTGTPFIVDTVDSASATTQASFFEIARRRKGGTGGTGTTPYTQDRFSGIRWRAGRNSASTSIFISYQFITQSVPCNPVTLRDFRGNGGGRHYFISDDHGNPSVDYRVVKITSTTEPLWLYAINAESTKDSTVALMSDANIELSSAHNIRIFGPKREARAPTILIANSTNVAMYTNGAMTTAGVTDFIKVTGTSDNILCSMILVGNQSATASGRNTLNDTVSTPVVIAWPDGISVYKRGTIDDSAVYIA